MADQNQDSRLSDAQPVPKESTASVSKQESAAAPPVQASPEQVSQPAMESQAAQPSPAQPEKKKGKNKILTCLLAGCGTCFVLTIILVLVVIFAGATVSKYLNNLLYSGVEIPDVKEVETDDLESDLNSVLTEDEAISFIVTEDEFNSYIQESLQKGENTGSEYIADFSDSEVDFYIKFSEGMPWVVIKGKSDSEGVVTTESAKVGSLDVTSFVTSLLSGEVSVETESYESESFKLEDLLVLLLFGDSAENLTVDAMYFEADQMRLTLSKTSTNQVEE